MDGERKLPPQGDGDGEKGKALVVVLVGAPGSGKSTFCENVMRASRRPWVRICQDNIANGKPGTRSQCIKAAAEALKDGKNIFVDRCNLDRGQRAEFMELGGPRAELHAVVLNLPARVCISRSVKRTGHEGNLQGGRAAAVVNRMLHSQEFPEVNEGFSRITFCQNDAEVRELVNSYSSLGPSDSLPHGCFGKKNQDSKVQLGIMRFLKKVEKPMELQSGGSDCQNPIPNEGGGGKSSCVLGARGGSRDQEEVETDDGARTLAFPSISTADFQFDHEKASAAHPAPSLHSAALQSSAAAPPLPARPPPALRRNMVGSRHRPEKEAAAELRPQLGLTANGRQRRRRLPLARRPVGFSPFFRSLSCRLLRRISTRSASDHAGLTPPLRSSTSPPPPPPAESTSEEEEEEEESDIMDENDDDDKEEEDAVEATVQVDFGFFDPKPGDFHGVKLLLRSYLGDREWDLSGFVDLILDQTTVGTVVKSENPEGEEQEEGEEEEAAAAGDGGEADEAEDVGPYAVITALNLGRYGTHQCIKELKNYILEACCEDPVKKKKLELMLGGKGAHDVGLLVCERFVNFPHQPVSPLYEGLFDEVSWATEDEPTQELRDSFRFKSYLILTRIFMRKDADLRGRSQISSGKKSKGRGSDDDEPIIYVKAEDEIFLKLCSLSFSFDLPRKEQVVPPELKGYKEMGLLMVIESSRVPAFREELKSFLLED